jgi:hypothetical protein
MRAAPVLGWSSDIKEGVRSSIGCASREAASARSCTIPELRSALACAPLTEAGAEAIVGKRLATPQPQRGGDCWYAEEVGAEEADKSMKEAVEKAGGTFKSTEVEPVPELKAPADYADPTLFVLGGYSARNVIDGSSRAARHAGTQHARADTPASSPITPT